MTTAADYQIKGFKTFKGHEGEPCGQGNLYKGSKKVAEWSDDSWGGGMLIRFTDPANESAFARWAKTYLATRKNFEGQPFDLKSMTKYAVVEQALQEMSYDHEYRGRMLKLCKKGIAYVAQGKPDLIYIAKTPYTSGNVARLKAQVPDIVEILNETFQLPFSA